MRYEAKRNKFINKLHFQRKYPKKKVKKRPNAFYDIAKRPQSYEWVIIYSCL